MLKWQSKYHDIIIYHDIILSITILPFLLYEMFEGTFLSDFTQKKKKQEKSTDPEIIIFFFTKLTLNILISKFKYEEHSKALNSV